MAGEALTHPQQQAYLALAAAAKIGDLDLPRERLLAVCDAPQHRQGDTPTGSLGTPIRVYWEVARNLLREDRARAARVVAEHLADMARVYGRNVRLAMANEWLWSNAAAPVDTVDLDVLSISRAAAHRVGPQLLRGELRSRTEGLAPVDRVALDIAVHSVGDMDDPGPPGPGRWRRRSPPIPNPYDPEVVPDPSLEGPAPPGPEDIDRPDPNDLGWDDPFSL